jgi:hypothetical protein
MVALTARVQVTQLWDDELAFSTEFIRKDVRNNSAWNQRMFVHRYTQRQLPDPQAWLHE